MSSSRSLLASNWPQTTPHIDTCRRSFVCAYASFVFVHKRVLYTCTICTHARYVHMHCCVVVLIRVNGSTRSRESRLVGSAVGA